MLKKLSTLYYKSSWLKSCTAVVVEHTFLFTLTCICHCTIALVSGNVKNPSATLTSSFSFTLSFFLTDNLSVFGLASLARRKPRFPGGRTSLRFLKGTKITVHEFLPKRRFRKTRSAIVIIFLRWQLTLFLQLELQLSPHWPLNEHPLLLFPLRFVLKELLQLHPCDLT